MTLDPNALVPFTDDDLGLIDSFDLVKIGVGLKRKFVLIALGEDGEVGEVAAQGLSVATTAQLLTEVAKRVAQVDLDQDTIAAMEANL